MASPRQRNAEDVRTLEWGFPGFDVLVEMHQIDADRWRGDEIYRTPDWHCVPSRQPRQLIALRALLRPRAER
jgi:hypothetical protein